MSEKLNLFPVEELLTKIASPESIANTLDALAFDYARTIIELEQATDYQNIMHEKTSEFIGLLQHLRDIFRACKIK